MSDTGQRTCCFCKRSMFIQFDQWLKDLKQRYWHLRCAENVLDKIEVVADATT